MRKDITMEQVINAYDVLNSVGQADLSIYFGRGSEDNLSIILSIINNMSDYNNKNNSDITSRLKIFINNLPGYHTKSNTNNEHNVFDWVKLHQDDTLMLTGMMINPIDIDSFTSKTKSLVNYYGELWHADEHDLYIEEMGFPNVYNCTIRFWWD